MYPNAPEVISKREEEFKRERHPSEPELAQRAVLQKTSSGLQEKVRPAAGLLSGLRVRSEWDWGTEELLLIGLILWQIFCKEPDVLLILVLVFLLFVE